MLNGLKHLLVAFLIGLILCPPSMVYANGIQVDPGAAAQNQATIDAAGNGVPLVNIAAPNASGLSHNKFLQFNVGTKGVILNNATIPGISQLGGALAPNANFRGQAASTILNEVTGTGRSNILGHTEIFGHSANYILANPNGISINGGGFINTPRATMTTGTPQFSGPNLLGINVTGGDILIHDAGINANNIDAFELVTRVATINADIYAKQLNVITGRNLYDPASGTATPLAPDASPTPSISIDSSALGGMYAGRIKLVGTEAGVGVNTEGLIQSTEQLEMTADGNIQIKGTASSAQALAIESTSNAVKVSGTVKAATTATVTGKTVTVAKVDATDKALVTADTVRINGGTLNNEHLIAADSDLGVATDTVTNTGTLYSGDTSLFRISDTLTNNQGTILSKNGAVFEGSTAGSKMAALVNNSGVIESLDGGLTFRATDFHNNNSHFTLVEGANNLGVEEGAFWHSGKHMGHVAQLFRHYLGSPLPSPLQRFGTIEVGLLAYTDLDVSKNLFTKEEVVAELVKLDAKLAADPNSLSTAVKNALAYQRQFIETDVKYIAKSIGRNDGLVIRIAKSRDTAVGQDKGSLIAAQGNILIESDTAKNTVSTISSATGNIEINATSFENVGMEVYDRATVKVGRAIFHRHKSPRVVPVGITTDVELTPIDQAYGTLDAGNKVIISSGTVTNGVVERNGIHNPPDPAAQANKITDVTDITDAIPANGLFQPNTNPAQNYLIETNPALTDLSVFYSTKYLAALVGTDPNDEANKRLGDAYYETQLVRRQIMELSGRRYLEEGIGTDTAQFKKLMDNAAEAHANLELSVGVSLSAEQVAALTDDIVWLERREVNGQEVLVPVVYLASASLEKIARGGSVIVAKDMEINATGDVTSAGLIKADNQVVITADNFFNTQGTAMGQTVAITATDSIRNTGGTIQGGTVTLKAGNDVVTSSDITVTADKGTTQTRISRRGKIASDGDLSIEAGRNVGIIGSDVEAGGKATIKAGKNVAISAQETFVKGQESGSGFNSSVDATFQHASAVKTGGDLDIESGKDTSVHGSTIEAGGNVAVVAGGNVSVTAAKHTVDFHAHSSGGGETDTTDIRHQRTVAAAIAAGGSVNIKSEADVNIHGSTLKATQNLDIKAGKDFNVTAAQDESFSKHHETGKGFMGSSSIALSEKNSVKTVRSHIETGNKVVLTAKEDVTLQATSIKSGDTTEITAEEGRIAMLVTKDSEYEHHIESKNGFFKWSMTDKGKTDEEVVHTLIQADAGLTFTTAEGVVVEYRETGNVKEDVAQLAQAPGLAWMGELLDRDDINWQAVQEVHNEWNKSDSGIGGPGMQLISLVMAVALSASGIGATVGGMLASSMGAASNGALATAMTAGFNALVVQAGTQVVANGGDIGAALEALASIDTVRILASAMLTAGLMHGISDTQFIQDFVGKGAPTDAVGLDKLIANLAQKLKQNAIQAGVNTGVNTAINGGNLGENLIANLRGAAVSALGAQLANEIGEAYQPDENGVRDIDYVTHKIAHAALGGAIAAANGDDIASGAIGGAVGEITGEVLAQEIQQALENKQIDPEKVQNWMNAGVDVSKLAAGLVAAVAGGEIDTAAGTAENAADNNAFFVAAAVILEIADKLLMAADIAEFSEAVITGNTEKRDELLLGFVVGMAVENTIGNVLPGSYAALRTAIKAGKLDAVMRLLPDSAINWIAKNTDDAFVTIKKNLADEFPDLAGKLDEFDFDGFKNSDEFEKVVGNKKVDKGTHGTDGSNNSGGSSGGDGTVNGGKISDPLQLPGHEGKLSARRNKPGAASYGGNLPRIEEGQRWLKGSAGNAGKVPAQVAEKLNGRKYANFHKFREAFWEAVADDPILSRQFSPSNRKLMEGGNAPIALPAEQIGNRKRYELDHVEELQHGGNVYDMNNIIIRTPYNHMKK